MSATLALDAGIVKMPTSADLAPMNYVPCIEVTISDKFWSPEVETSPTVSTWQIATVGDKIGCCELIEDEG